ncbi:MAG: glycosyltransferase family 39 protein [Proteobacteria bacterium]|nr:glycosyltransferase family 39 protein [Pseudomonadota bacterium]
MTASPSTAEPRRGAWRWLAGLWVFLLVLAALRPLAVPDEGRYGEVGRWMLQSGDWLTPRLDGLPFFHKPPLLYWLEAGSLALFGNHVWALRLVPALHAGAMLAALYLAARRIAGERIARRAALMLGTSVTFLLGGQYVNHDMMVATWIGLSIWCFAFSFMHGARPHAGLARWGFVAAALGVLSKGMIGAVLPGMVLFLWLLWTRQWRKLLAVPWASGVLLFALIAVPWFVLVWLRYPGAMDYLFGTQQFTRYLADTFNNVQPWWFYVVGMALLLFPWAFFALGPLWQGLRRRAAAAEGIAPEWVSLCWIWIVAILVFFTVPASKLIGYILPVIPPLALLAALGWERSVARWRFGRGLFALLALLIMAGALVISLEVASYTDDKLSVDVAATLACDAAPDDTIYVVGKYPYDLPFYIQTPKPLVVIQDWPEQRRNAGDVWQRELFEGAAFDPKAARVLQTPDVLAAASAKSGNWLLAPREDTGFNRDHPGWQQVQVGTGWVLYRSQGSAERAEQAGGSAAKGPEPAQQKGLPGCKH